MDEVEHDNPDSADIEQPRRRSIAAPPLAMDMPVRALRPGALAAAAFLWAMAAIALVTGAGALLWLPLLLSAMVATGAAAMRARPARLPVLRLRRLARQSRARPHDAQALVKLLDAAECPVVVRGEDGVIRHASAAARTLLGLRVGGRLEEAGIELPAPWQGGPTRDEIAGHRDFPVTIDGERRWFAWIERPVASGTATDSVAVALDITERRKAEEAEAVARRRAEEADRDKSRFLATVSHEIRTPLNGTLGMAKLLQATELTPEQSTYVGAITTSAGALLALIEDLLDISRIESGRFVLDARPASPLAIAENVVELLADRAHAKGLGLSLFATRRVPALAELDAGKLRQVLLNLVGNAVKFTLTGGVNVELDLTTDEGGGNDLVLRVRDTGAGLRASDLERIFEEFEQVEQQGAGGEGSGLGLAIANRLAFAMGGRIEVESRYGEGSVFTCRVPVRSLEPGQPGQPLAGRRVLIVSANHAEAEGLAGTIRDQGGEAIVARTPEEAAAGRGGPLDVTIVDAQLEDALQGTMLARLKRELGDIGLPVTLIGPRHRSGIGDLRAQGYAHFLLRPVRRVTLLRVLLSELAEALPVPGSAARRTAATVAPLRVLLAEDNEINALLAVAALKRAGHAVDVVDNGRAALDRMTRAAGPRYDVVLMDLQMPVMSGREALRHVRRHEEAHRLVPLPIVVLTAEAGRDVATRVGELGATAMLAKPADPAAIVAAVETHARALSAT